MKKRYFQRIAAVHVVAALLLCIFCGCRKTEDPIGDGTQNKAYDIETSELLQPVFSDRGGFYGNKMAVRLTVPALLQSETASVRITFDGSEPDRYSAVYEGEDILLPDAGCIRTDFSRDTENVAVTVLRAACFDAADKLVGQIATATYIQLPKTDGVIRTDRFDLPVISLVTDKRNLSDPQTGIFTNVNGKGSEWERPVHIAFFEADGRLALAQDAGIRLFGGSTRNLVQKSFRITARKASYFQTERYDGAGKFKYALFPERVRSDGALLTEYDSIVLRNGGNDALFVPEDKSRITMMRDGLVAQIAQKAAPEVDVMAYRPVIVFLNGEYYGVMNLREYENNKYIQNVYGIEDKDGITVISAEMDTQNGERYDGTWFYYKQDDGPAGELGRFTDLLDGIVSGRFTYEEAARHIDMEQFLKYCAVNLFVCNTDWPHNNVRVWRYAGNHPGASADSTVTDGKWRFMLKDADVGLGRYTCGMQEGYPIEVYTKADCRNIRLLLCNYLTFPDSSGYPDVSEHSYPDTLRIQGLFYFCMQNSGFASRFYAYCEELATELWTPAALETLISQSAAVLRKEFMNAMQKDFGVWQWQAQTHYNAWENAVFSTKDSLYTWARERSGADGEFLKQVKELQRLLPA